MKEERREKERKGGNEGRKKKKERTNEQNCCKFNLRFIWWQDNGAPDSNAVEEEECIVMIKYFGKCSKSPNGHQFNSRPVVQKGGIWWNFGRNRK